MKYSRYLIASDLDGTFFGKGTSVLTQNLEAIEDFKRGGGIFSIASGRSRMVLDSLYPHFPEVANGLSILAGGAYLYDFAKEEMLDTLTLDHAEALALMREIDRVFPSIGLRISTPKFFLCPKKTAPLLQNVSELMDLCRFDAAEKYPDTPWYKLVYVGEIPEIESLRRFLYKNGYFDAFSISWSADYGIEIIPRGATKGNSVKKLKEYYPDRTIICVGDHNNDLDMLRVADIPACPANALDEVKALAKIRLCHHEEGCIADLIRRL